MKTSFTSLLAALLAGFGLNTSALAAQASAETLKNLNAAYQGESNAAHRYKLFAEAAEKEGHAQVAKLFRAASAAEEIHRDTHKRAIESLGGKVETFELDKVELKTTAENLQAAIQGESYERDTMYPEFLATAKKDDAKQAIRSFQFAVKAEAEHAKLYKAALDQLGKNPAEDYYVCEVCGMTVTKLPEKKCPSCRQGVEKYKKVS